MSDAPTLPVVVELIARTIAPDAFDRTKFDRMSDYYTRAGDFERKQQEWIDRAFAALAALKTAGYVVLSKPEMIGPSTRSAQKRETALAYARRQAAVGDRGEDYAKALALDILVAHDLILKVDTEGR